MSTRTREDVLTALELPDPFEDLTGIIGSDLKVIARNLAERAGERLLLSRTQTHKLQRTLWNKLTEAINESMESLTVERH
jgi:hypothetical protein